MQEAHRDWQGPRPEGVFYSHTIQLSEGGQGSPVKGQGVKHPQQALHCAWRQRSQHTGVQGWKGLESRPGSHGQGLDDCCSPSH